MYLLPFKDPTEMMNIYCLFLLFFSSFCFVVSCLLFFFVSAQVEDVNDNAPLTSDPIYHPTIMENSPKDVSVIRIQAQDPDLTAIPSRLSYRITAGNPQNFFSINPKTGEVVCDVVLVEWKGMMKERMAPHKCASGISLTSWD